MSAYAHLLLLAAPSPATSNTPSWAANLLGLAGPLIGCTIAFLVVFWLSLIIWTFRDIRSRTQDFLSQIISTVLVTVFPVGGLFIYLILRPRQTLAEIYERQLEEESLLAEMTERQTCSNCHARIEGDFQVCPSCGQKLKRPCPKCERLLELRWTYCPYCATNLVGSAGAMPGISSNVQNATPNSGVSMGGAASSSHF
ncbi:zinc ribbon domain-containing protein [Ktedonosporobacter rubrisoli]|uniref:zinc ribbon domain-containing protein n=1 Tax=Ktedonosporobacter rubrisoli TaxID=2509675 RepID=UPI0013EE6634|nr:zinc ribbon domain-containing protein [Ktedonosporobacter rubrisoli]